MQALDRVLNLELVFAVEGLVASSSTSTDGGAEHSPAQGDSLSFASRGPHAAIAHHGFQSLRQGGDKPIRRRPSQCFPQFVVIGGWLGRKQVGADGVVQQMCPGRHSRCSAAN